MANTIMQGTTPTFVLTLPNTIDLTTAQNVYVTFEQGSQNSLTKKGEELVVYANQVEVYLSQKETLKFKEGDVLMQMNWTFNNGKRAATYKVKLDWDYNLLRREVQ